MRVRFCAQFYEYILENQWLSAVVIFHRYGLKIEEQSGEGREGTHSACKTKHTGDLTSRLHNTIKMFTFLNCLVLVFSMTAKEIAAFFFAILGNSLFYCMFVTVFTCLSLV